MTSWGRRAALAGGVIGIAVSLVVAGGALGGPSGAPNPSAAPVAAQSTGDALTQSTAALQERLRRVPNDPQGWAGLGMNYVQQARVTADPSFYPRAQGAFAKSLALQPKDNAGAITGQAILASAQHNFSEALRLANRALAINDFSSTAYGVKADALTELGRYPDAATAVQRMLNLQPGTPSFSRASYQRELRGDVPGAREALVRAADATTSPADMAFAYYYLGELAWNNGDQKQAREQYDAALAADQAYLPALVGVARTTAAAGDPTAALALYREAVQALPLPANVIELGELLEATGQTAAAKDQYDVVRASQQLFAAAGANVDLELALFEADHGSPAASLRYAKAAYRDRPEAVLVEDAYAWALHVSGRDAEALPIARQAQRLGTRLPVLRYHLGVIEAAVGERKAAKASLQGALALNPTFNPLQAPKARALLKTLS
ncbi:MAG: tetratricopeptide repeat protein [Mycobacteriales bacterium]